jgi:hypothetical protein
MSGPDLRFRSAERLYRAEMTDAAETAYWDEWERLGMPDWAAVPWHIRCPSILPRAGDRVGSRIVLAARGDRVTFFRVGQRVSQVASCSGQTWLRWAREHPRVELHAGRRVPGAPRTRNGEYVPGVSYPKGMILWATRRHEKELAAMLKRAGASREAIVERAGLCPDCGSHVPGHHPDCVGVGA